MPIDSSEAKTKGSKSTGRTEVRKGVRRREREREPGWINLKYDTDWLAIPHQRFIIERHTCASPHRSRRPRQIGKDQEGLTAHFGTLRRDDIDHLPVGCEKRVELGTELFFVDLVVQVVDVERRVGLDGWVHFDRLRQHEWAFVVRTTKPKFPRLENSYHSVCLSRKVSAQHP